MSPNAAQIAGRELGIRTNAARRRAERDRLAEDLTWLLDTDTPQHVAARVGAPSVSALVRRMCRHGRPDLAQRLGWSS